jgi:hypothetical protein
MNTGVITRTTAAHKNQMMMTCALGLSSSVVQKQVLGTCKEMRFGKLVTLLAIAVIISCLSACQKWWNTFLD